ncbi:orexin receptor type 2 isoform X2 [Polyergus mexicanus]|uniref:orexin receptor type 2 isoform X2 n=1 Tax=Polyergus mexicanus TaxID=615972 RepID=UPI0038B44ED4
MDLAVSIIVAWLATRSMSNALDNGVDYYLDNVEDLEYVNATNCTNDYCISDEDYIGLMVQHIFPKFTDWVLIAMHSIVFVVGLIGNALVCMAVYRNHTMRTVTNYFIVNLAVADLLVLLICLPPSVLWDVTETWFLGLKLCKTVPYLQTVSVSVSVLTLTFISIDRWYAICFPLRFKSTTGRAKTAIIVIWLIALLFVSTRICHSTEIPLSRSGNPEGQLRSRRKAAKMLVVIVITFAICFFPVHLLAILRCTMALPSNQWTIAFSLIAHWLCYFNSAVNPVIYNFMSGKFRKEFKRNFRCFHNNKTTCIHKREYVTGISDPLKQRSRTYTRSVHTLSNNNNVQQSTEVIPLSAIINIPQSEKQE